MAFKKILVSKTVRADSCGELVDKTVSILRVSKVVKGGRRFSFSALVVTGDGQGHVGYGIGKANEVPEALRKASQAARKNLIKVPIKGTTIPHDCFARYGASKVVMKPAGPGTGVIAGSAARAVIESAGIKDIRTKSVGSNRPSNLVKATIDGLMQLREPETVAMIRGRTVEVLGYKTF